MGSPTSGDQAGHLTAQTVSGITTSYGWYNTGLAASVTTGSAVTSYGYDAAGNRLSEGYVVAGVTYEASSMSWDALGRKLTFHDAGVSREAPVTVSYAYDAVGNVRRVQSQYQPLDSYGNAGTVSSETDSYAYDNMNRVVQANGATMGFRTTFITTNARGIPRCHSCAAAASRTARSATLTRRER